MHASKAVKQLKERETEEGKLSDILDTDDDCINDADDVFVFFFSFRRLIAPNIRQKEFLAEGAVSVSQQVRHFLLLDKCLTRRVDHFDQNHCQEKEEE